MLENNQSEPCLFPGSRQPTPVFSPGESPWTEEPGRLQSLWSQRVIHDRERKHSAARVKSLSSPPSPRFCDKSRVTGTRYEFSVLSAGFTASPEGNEYAMPETQVRSLGWEDPLEKRMATHSSSN